MYGDQAPPPPPTQLGVEEIHRAYAWNRSVAWNSSTGVLRTIRDHLTGRGPAMTKPEQARTNWLTDSGETVSIGDYVALDISMDSVGRIVDVAGDHTGRPVVLLTEGAGPKQRFTVWPGQMLLKVRR